MAVVFGVAAAVLLVLQMLLLSWVVRDVLLRHKTLHAIVPTLLLAAGTAIGRASLISLHEFAAKRSAIRVKRQLRQQVAEHLLRLGPAYTSDERTGEVLATVTDGIEKLDPYISRYLPQTILSVAVPLIIVLAILPVDPLSAGLLLFTVPIIVLLMVLIGTYTRDHVQQQWATLGQLSSAFLDIIQGLPTLLLLNQEMRERRRVEALSERFRDRTLAVLKVAFISGAVLELMTAAGIGLVATILGVRLLDSAIPLDRAFFVFLLTPAFYRPLRDLGAHRHAVIEGSAAADRILEILETPAGEPSTADGSLPEGPLSVELEGISYVYPERKQPALSHVSFSLPVGTCTALIGRSGSGKTTLINLLLRALEPVDGIIRVNGVPVGALPIDLWRAQVALVPQRPYLFCGTLRDNIRLARPAASDEAVGRAAALAGCTPFISELPDGLDTIIGERGETLSAGQRQRLAIARAFLKDSPFLVLDEPTSALDPESEEQIGRALTLLRGGRTVLVVAHRRHTIEVADRVVVLDRGRLVEVGRHDELSLQNGVYASLMGQERQAIEEVA